MSTHLPHGQDGLEVATHSDNYPEAVPQTWKSDTKPLHVWKETQEPQTPNKPPRKLGSFAILSLGTIAVLVVVIAVISGVLGSTVHRLSKDKQRYQNLAAAVDTLQCDNSSTTPTTSQAQTTLTNGVLMGRNDCPEINNTNFTISTYTFVRLCGIDYYDGSQDLSQLVTASMEDCIAYCVQFNKLVQGNQRQTCKAIVYQPTLSAALSKKIGNCFIKKNRTNSPVQAAGMQSAYMIDNTGSYY